MDAQKLFDDIAQFVEQSRELLKSGAMMELAGLDERVLLLCEEVLLLSQEERVQYGDKLQQLLGDLKSLGEEMTAQRDRIGAELNALPQHKKATVAYRVAEESDKYKRDGGNE